jgi:tetratricopeptide (TPR) repeat protein
MIRRSAYRIGVFAACLVTIFVTICPTPSRARQDAAITPYDAELYETGYQVFLMNGNVADGLRLAESALRQRPDDTVWRRRAAQCAEWSGEPATALKHWMHLAMTTGDREAGDRALKLAEGLRDFRTTMDLLKRRLYKGADIETARAFVAAAESMGENGEAIAVLEKLRGGAHGKYALEELPRLYEADGSPEKAIRALQEYGRNYRHSSRSLLHLATLQYGTGDLEGAYRSLKGGLDTSAAEDPEYLAATGDLCWRMQDMDCAVSAARKRVRMGKPGEEDYRRMMFVMRESNPGEAFGVAREACERFGSPAFFNEVADLGEQQGKWRELELFLNGMGADERVQLERTSRYWVLRARVSGHLGRVDESVSSYRQALRLEPGDGNLRAGYVWLLLDLDRSEDLKEAVRRWPEMTERTPQLADALGAAHVYLGNYGTALMLFRERYPARKDDPLWSLAFGDVLEQNNLAQEAFGERMRGLRVLQAGTKGLESSSSAREKSRADLARFLLQLQRGDRLDALMENVIRGSSDPETKELVAAWALSTERNDFARWWLVRQYAANGKKPAWVELGLALEENDRDKMAALLAGKPDHLPYRDAIEAAQRAGSHPLSEEMAWQRSWTNPDDYLLYEQVRDIYSRHPSFAAYGLRLLDRGGIGGLENWFDMSLPLTRRFNLTAGFSHTINSSLKDDVLADYPAGDTRARVGIGFQFHKGTADLALGWRSALDEVITFGASASYQLFPRVQVTGDFGYSAPADESIPLIIGGVKDFGAIRFSCSPTVRDTIQAGFSHVVLRDQSRNLLGSGWTYTLDVSHRLTFSYPDFSVRAFTGYYDYSRDRAPRGDILELVPPGSAGDASFFVPDSYFQVGIGADFGQAYREVYSQNWKPFGSTSVSWRTDSGVGFDFGLGTHGPVFGCDSLWFQFSLSRGTASSEDLSGIAEMGYKYFFN